MQEYAFLRRVRGHIGPTCTVLEFGPAVETPRAQNYAALRAARMTTLLRDGTPATPRVQQIGAIPPSATRLDTAEQLALSDDFIAHPPLHRIADVDGARSVRIARPSPRCGNI